MQPKKYSEVNYIANKPKKPLWIAVILILIFFIVLQIAIIVKLTIEDLSLIKENEKLNKVIEMKNSQIADLEENCKDLFIENQNLKFGDD